MTPLAFFGIIAALSVLGLIIMDISAEYFNMDSKIFKSGRRVIEADPRPGEDEDGEELVDFIKEHNPNSDTKRFTEARIKVGGSDEFIIKDVEIDLKDTLNPYMTLSFDGERAGHILEQYFNARVSTVMEVTQHTPASSYKFDITLRNENKEMIFHNAFVSMINLDKRKARIDFDFCEKI